VLILEHYFASKSFAAVAETFRNAYPHKKVQNKTTIYRSVSKFRYTGSVCEKCSMSDKTLNYGRTDFKQCISCNNGIQLQEFNTAIGFEVLCVKGFMCSS
jgi:hypothetical protein